MRTPRPLAALGTALALAAVLTGCSVSVVDDAKPSPATASGPAGFSAEDARETPPAADPGSSPTASTASTAPPAVQNPPAAKEGGITRDDLVAGATTVQRCDRELTLMQDGMAIHVEGSCEHLIVNARGAQIVADDVAALEIIGDANLVLTGPLQKVTVNGSGNVVKWTGATPTVSDVGSANTLTAG